MKKIILFGTLMLTSLSYNSSYASVTYVDEWPKGPPSPEMSADGKFIPFRHGIVIVKNPSQQHKADLLKPGVTADDIEVYKECTKSCQNIREHWVTYLENLKQVPSLVYKHLSNMKLDFPYKGIKFLSKDQVLLNIGTTTAGQSDKNSKLVFGGVKQLLLVDDYKTLCSFSIENLEHIRDIVAQDMITHLLNNKITRKVSVRGKEKLGYMYYIRWYDDLHSYALSCGYLTHDIATRQKVIDLAKLIDSDLDQQKSS